MVTKQAKYQIIVDDIRDSITSGKWQPDRLIPSQSELASLYHTSEITSRRALAELVNEGLIYRIRGKGSYVKSSSGAAEAAALDSAEPPAKILERIYLVHNTGGNIFLLEHRFYGEMFRGILAEAERRGLEFLFWDYSLEKQLPSDDRACFIITSMGSNDFSQEMLREWVEEERQIVTVHSYFPQLSVPYVIIDNMTGGYLATEHLLSLGHTRIGILLTGPSVLELNQEFSLRLQGYRLALNLQHIPFDPQLVCVIDVESEHQKQGEQGFDYFSGLADPPTAIFATSDIKAYGLMRAARLAGCSVPGDLSIVGYDNMDFGLYLGLTTVDQNSHVMGRKAVEILSSDKLPKERMASLKDEIVPELVVRKSTAALIK
ncbi:GntR family transcriptional regulator [Paenibacillus nasutitermitis]|uniref:GntR family transcriptional regulator n=1 Tax=Paenibacillus nasutitermitis TaxID=1652958 RepID=A0A917E0B2_9BACL|nr:substrate-binding domain-containing protein [Paenibacillus nasutitermitis]GGD84591.1 GntR family transcriptional regulator [Paenibacillus nasutitermitis]